MGNAIRTTYAQPSPGRGAVTGVGRSATVVIKLGHCQKSGNEREAESRWSMDVV